MILAVLFLSSLALTTKVSAQTPQPTELTRDQAMNYPMLGFGGCSGTPGSSAPSAKINGKNIYILGDSITAGAKDAYKDAFKDKDLTISARVGRSWGTAGQDSPANIGSQGTGKEAFAADTEKIKSADAIIIALGTNQMGGDEASQNPIGSIITAFRGVNEKAPIWWVNIANSGVAGVPSFNETLKQQAGDKYTVIDWAKTVDPTGDGTNNPGKLLSTDGTHPSSEGTKKLVDLVVSAVTSGAGVQNNGVAAGDCKCSSGGTTGGGDAITKFLQALAFQESGGQLNLVSSGSARGKFQYIDSTWKGVAQKYYPHALKYANANGAPESVQDALVYIEYTDKFNTFNGDLFKLAVSHFYPLANQEAKWLDIIPPSNVVTPRQYAEKLVAGYNSGAGKEIKFYYNDAPEFKESLAAVGGQTTASVKSGEGSCSAPGQIGPGEAAGKIVETALNLAWDTKKDGLIEEKDAKPTYQAAMPKFNGSTNTTGDPKLTPWSDCGVFVATVMHMSGVDTAYPKRNTLTQEPYTTNSERYERITNVTDSSQLKPGDIIINKHHTMIFVGPQTGPAGEYNTVDASFGDRVPGAKVFAPHPDTQDPDSYDAYRIKG